jgi:hypothetical protein
MTGAGFPDPMPAAALTGPIGETVLALEAQVETCREALLAETLVFFGNVLGRTAHVRVARTHHYANEFVVLVGQSSRSRKGTVRDVAVDLVGFTDPVWQERGVLSGATSGEGIIAAVRDPTRKRRRANRKEKADADLAAQIDSEGYLVEVLDEGVEDKRAVFDEAELSSVFKVALREGNTLSERFRKFYDKGSDQITNKNSPMRATAAHVSINGHITREELRARLTELDSANGWANRFVYVATRRVRRLPGHVIGDFDLAELAQPLGEAIVWARASEPELAWEESAWKDWCRFYAAVPDDVHGIAGALAARAEAHVLRFAIIYAVAERSSEITFAHLDAALAVWDYCERSIAWAWDGRLRSTWRSRCSGTRASPCEGSSRPGDAPPSGGGTAISRGTPHRDRTGPNGPNEANGVTSVPSVPFRPGPGSSRATAGMTHERRAEDPLVVGR